HSDSRVPRQGTVLYNHSLASQLNVAPGEELIIRVEQPGYLSEDAAVTQRRDRSISFRLKAGGTLPQKHGGELDLRSSGAQVMNAFVDGETLSARLGISNRANLILVGPVTRVDRSPPHGSRKYYDYARRVVVEWITRRPSQPRPELCSTSESLKL